MIENDCVIYDFETLSQIPQNGVAVAMAILSFNEERFLSETPYEFAELIDASELIRFDTKEQIQKFGRQVQKSTLEWWKNQGEEAQKILQPSDDDVSITELYDFIMDYVPHAADVRKVYTRGNTFDPIFLQSLLEIKGHQDPFPWWTLRDTRSMIDGMAYGEGISNKFVPKGLENLFVAHDPRHDIAADVMRLQVLARAINGLDVKSNEPF